MTKELLVRAVKEKQEVELKKKGLFHFLGKLINKKIAINISPKEGTYIIVDADFLEYCAKYYDKKVKEKEEEIKICIKYILSIM